MDVEAARDRARLKAAALSARGGGEAQSSMHVFDRVVKAAQRDRAAYLRRAHPSGDVTDPFLEEVTGRLLDRLADVKRTFPRALVLGGASDAVVRRLLSDRPDVRHIVVTDISADMLDFVRANVERERGAEALDDEKEPSSRASKSAPADADAEDENDASSHAAYSLGRSVRTRNSAGHDVTIHFVRCDEEALPIRANSVDVAIAALGLHWANDLPGAMAQAREALKPDSLFLSAVLGGDTLRELRVACAVAELEREGGVSSRVSPLARVRDCGNLLTRAGMRLPAVDVDRIAMAYPTPRKLVEHLRLMGETNAGVRRRPGPIARTTAAAAEACYASMFPRGGEGEGEGGGAEEASSRRGVECTYEILYMTGWSPGDGQQQPAERGSATVSLAKLEEELAKVSDGGPDGEGGAKGAGGGAA